jgi:hypothetical protein
VTIRVSERAASEQFYETVLPAVSLDKPRRGDYYTEWGDFSIAQADEAKPVTVNVVDAGAATADSGTASIATAAAATIRNRRGRGI